MREMVLSEISESSFQKLLGFGFVWVLRDLFFLGGGGWGLGFFCWLVGWGFLVGWVFFPPTKDIEIHCGVPRLKFPFYLSHTKTSNLFSYILKSSLTSMFWVYSA